MDGFKEWCGGNKAPSDWTPGDPVKFRSGITAIDKDWHWLHNGGSADIIAYRPTPPKFNVGDKAVTPHGLTGTITSVIDTDRVMLRTIENGISYTYLAKTLQPAPWQPDEQTVQHCAPWLVLRKHPTLAADLKRAMGPADPVEELARELYAVIYSDHAYDRDADKAYWSKLARHVMERGK